MAKYYVCLNIETEQDLDIVQIKIDTEETLSKISGVTYCFVTQVIRKKDK